MGGLGGREVARGRRVSIIPPAGDGTAGVTEVVVEEQTQHTWTQHNGIMHITRSLRAPYTHTAILYFVMH